MNHYKRWNEVTRKVVRDDPDDNMGRDVLVRDGFGATSPGTRMVPCWLVLRIYKPKSKTKPIQYMSCLQDNNTRCRVVLCTKGNMSLGLLK